MNYKMIAEEILENVPYNPIYNIFFADLLCYEQLDTVNYIQTERGVTISNQGEYHLSTIC